MNDARIQELISAAADGVLSTEEQVELDRLLEASPEAGRLQSDLSRLESILREIPALDPPDSLHGRIMDHAKVPAAPSTRTFASWLHPLASGAVLRYGLATAFGLLLAVGFYESQPKFSSTMDIDALVGTMAPNDAQTNAEILDIYAFRAKGLESQLQLERRNGNLLFEIQIDADEPVDISADFARAGVRIGALAQIEASVDSIEIVDQELRVRALGRHRLTALLERVDDSSYAGEATIDFKFSMNGKFLQQGSLTAAW